MRWLAMVSVGLLVGCETSTDGRSAVELVVERLEAAPAGTSDFSTELYSDVSPPGPLAGDVGRVIFRAQLRDPGTAESPTAPANSITLTHYRVVFRRADGRGVQGFDVPYSFDGAITASASDVPGEAVFTLVRGQARLEPPLAALRGGGGAIAISTLAEVTFSGQDGRGRTVQRAGRIAVHFGDWDALPPGRAPDGG
jgi:hypothetical protein